MNRKNIFEKLPRTIPQESANVSLIETLINLLQQSRGEKAREKRGREKKIPSGTIVIEEIPQVEEQLRPSRQWNNLVELLNVESNDAEKDVTTCKI